MFFPQLCHFIKRKGEKTEGVALGNKRASGVGGIVEKRNLRRDTQSLLMGVLFSIFFEFSKKKTKKKRKEKKRKEKKKIKFKKIKQNKIK